MQPQVESAWIAVSGGFLGALVGVTATVIVARAGFNATTRGLTAQVDAERRSRVWDQQAAAYSEVITSVRHRQRERHRQWIAMVHMDQPPEPAPAPVDWPALEDRLLAFASPAVMKAFEASQTGTAEYRVTMEEWQKQRAQGDETDEHRQRTLESLVSANSIDAGLVELIRVELHAGASREPEPVLPTGSASDADSQNRGKRPNWLRARAWAGTRSGDARP